VDTYIETKKLSVRKSDIDILSDISISIYKNKINAIIGPNGAGKTTLLHAILGLCPYSGDVIFNCDGVPNVGYVPQRFDFTHNMPITVIEFMALSQQRRPLWAGISRKAKEKSLQCLSKVLAEKLVDKLLFKLSGGELQRVLLALALTNEPDIILMDEPVSGVDVAGEEAFCNLLTQLLSERELSIVLVSHDLSMVTAHAEHVICINKTLQCQGGVVEVLTKENIEKIYGISFGLYAHNNRCQTQHTECPPIRKS